MKLDKKFVKFAAAVRVSSQIDNVDDNQPELKIPRKLRFNRRTINVAIEKLFSSKPGLKERVRVDPRLGEIDDENHSRQL